MLEEMHKEKRVEDFLEQRDRQVMVREQMEHSNPIFRFPQVACQGEHSNSAK